MNAHLRRATLILLPLALALATGMRDRPRIDLRGHRGAVSDIAIHPGGKLVASIGVEESIWLWNLDTGRVVRRLEPRGRTVDGWRDDFRSSRRIEAIVFSPDGRYLAEAAVENTRDGVIRLWNPETGELVRTVSRDARNLRSIAFSPDGKLLAANLRDGLRPDHKIVLLDVEKGERVAELKAERLAATTLVFSPDGKTLVSIGGTRVHIWDVPSRSVRHTFATHKKAIQAIAFAPDNRRVATASSESRIRIWDTDTGTRVRSIKHKQGGVLSLAFSPSGLTLASGGEDGTIKLWNPDAGRCRKTIWAHSRAVTALEFGAAGTMLASGSRDSTIAIWDIDEPSKVEAAAKVKEAEDEDADQDADDDDEDDDDDDED